MAVKSLPIPIPELSIIFRGGEHYVKMRDALITSGVGRDGHGITKTDALVWAAKVVAAVSSATKK